MQRIRGLFTWNSMEQDEFPSSFHARTNSRGATRMNIKKEQNKKPPSRLNSPGTQKYLPHPPTPPRSPLYYTQEGLSGTTGSSDGANSSGPPAALINTESHSSIKAIIPYFSGEASQPIPSQQGSDVVSLPTGAFSIISVMQSVCVQGCSLSGRQERGAANLKRFVVFPAHRRRRPVVEAFHRMAATSVHHNEYTSSKR